MPKWAKFAPAKQCKWSRQCAAPAVNRLYCRKHTDKSSKRSAGRRALRMSLGFCLNCLQRALPGAVRCEKHQAENAATQSAYKERRRKARGWKLVRVAT